MPYINLKNPRNVIKIEAPKQLVASQIMHLRTPKREFFDKTSVIKTI